MGKKATYLLSKALFAIATYVLALMGLAGWLAGMVPPRVSWFVSFIALGMTPIIILNLMIFVVWAIKRRWIVIAPLIALALNWGYISSMVQIDFRSEKDVPLAEFQIATYNIHGYTHKDFAQTITDMLQYFDEKSVDVVCMQEFCIINDSIADSVWRKMYPYTVQVSAIRGMQLAVFSKYPIVGHKYFEFKGTANGAMYADVNVDDHKLRIFNVHLQTTNINQSQGDISRLRNLGIDDPAGKKAFDSIMNRMSDNATLRVDQVKLICDQIAATSDRLIFVCGDFNDTPSSFAYRQIQERLDDGFRTAGSGYAYTFKDMYRLFRLDYILHDKAMRGVGYQSLNAPWSDHNPVIMSLAFGNSR